MSFPTTTDVSAGDFGRASWADEVRADLTQLALAEFPLGGDLDRGIVVGNQSLPVPVKRE